MKTEKNKQIRLNRPEIILTEKTQESVIEKLFRIIAILFVVIFPVACIFCVKVVKQYQRAVILRFGRIRKDSPAGPGIILVVPCTDSVVIIDLRTRSFNLPLQEILTKDSVTVAVDAVVYFHVVAPLKSLLNVQNHKYATELLAIATLRNVIGQHSLSDLLTTRESISWGVRNAIDKCTSDWGVEVERVEIKDVVLPFDLQKAMAAEAEATRIGKAKIIEAEGEIKAAENLREASRIIVENPGVMILRYLQTLNYLATQQSTTIIFPFPMELPDHTGVMK